MCLIIHKPAGTQIDRSVLRSAARTNNDGFGILWTRQNGTIDYIKEVDMDLLEPSVDTFTIDDEIAVHLRMRTHGDVSRENTHPFLSDDGRSALMHNGILNAYSDAKSSRSDTALYAELQAFPCLELATCPESYKAIADELEKDMGYGNRLLIVREGLGFRRLGSWTAKDGVHYSNGSHLYGGTWLKYYSHTGKPGKRKTYDLDPDVLTDLIGVKYERLVEFARNDPETLAWLVFEHLGKYTFPGINSFAGDVDDDDDAYDDIDAYWTSAK